MKMNAFLENLFFKSKPVKIYFILSLLIILLSYSVYLFSDENTINKLGAEDGFFEYLTAISFLAASIIFILMYFLKKKIIYLLFAIIFFIGMGEEISWGQRLFNYGTPEYFEKNNIQDEVNLHNLKIFDSKNFEGQYKFGFIIFPFNKFSLQTFLADLWRHITNSLFFFPLCEKIL